MARLCFLELNCYVSERAEDLQITVEALQFTTYRPLESDPRFRNLLKLYGKVAGTAQGVCGVCVQNAHPSEVTQHNMGGLCQQQFLFATH